MAKVWFGRKSLTLDTEQIFMNATTLADCTLNGERVLTSEDVPAAATTAFTLTLLPGGITTSTLRSIANPTAAYPITCSRIGSVVTLTFPAFNVTAQSGAGDTFNLTGASQLAAQFRPTYELFCPVPLTDAGGDEIGRIHVFASGDVDFVLNSGGVFTLPSGIDQDVTISYNVI